jgi:hypothetical protein
MAARDQQNESDERDDGETSFTGDARSADRFGVGFELGEAFGVGP